MGGPTHARGTKAREASHPYHQGDRTHQTRVGGAQQPPTPLESLNGINSYPSPPSLSPDLLDSRNSPHSTSLPSPPLRVQNETRRSASEPEPTILSHPQHYRWNAPTATDYLSGAPPLDFNPNDPHHQPSRRVNSSSDDQSQQQAQPQAQPQQPQVTATFHPPAGWTYTPVYHYPPYSAVGVAPPAGTSGGSAESREAGGGGTTQSTPVLHYPSYFPTSVPMDRAAPYYPRFPPGIDPPDTRYNPSFPATSNTTGIPHFPTQHSQSLPEFPSPVTPSSIPTAKQFAPPPPPSTIYASSRVNPPPSSTTSTSKSVLDFSLPQTTSSQSQAQQQQEEEEDQLSSTNDYGSPETLSLGSNQSDSEGGGQTSQHEGVGGGIGGSGTQDWSSVTTTLGSLCARAGVRPPFGQDQLVVVWDGRLQRALKFDSTEAHYLEPHEENELIVFPRGSWVAVKDKHGYDATPWSSGKGANDWLRAQAEHCLCKRFRFWQGEKRESKHPSVIRDHVSACASRDAMDPLARLCRLERQAEKRAKEARQARAG